MKRSVSSVLCIALFVLCLAFSLSSCKEDPVKEINSLEGKDRAAALLSYIDKVECDSYTVDSTAELSLQTAPKSTTTVRTKQVGVFEFEGSALKSRRTDTETTTTVKSADPVVSRQTVAYADGKLSIIDKDAGVGIFSQATPEAAEKFFDLTKVSDLSLDDIKNIACDYTAGEGWTLTLSGLSGKTLGTFSKAVGAIDGSTNSYLADVSLVVKVSEDFMPENISAEYIFEGTLASAYIPTMTMEMAFRDIGSSKVEVDLAGCIEVPDISILKKLGDTLDELKLAKEGAFTASVSTVTKIANFGVLYTETDDVSFSRKNGKFSYLVSSMTSEQVNLRTEYSDGEQKKTKKSLLSSSSSSSNPTTTKQTDMGAKAFIYGIADPGNFNMYNIRLIELKRSGDNRAVYELMVAKPDSSLFSASLRELDVNKDSVKYSATVTVVTVNGEISGYTYTCTCSGKTKDGKNNFSITVTSRLSDFCYSSEN